MTLSCRLGRSRPPGPPWPISRLALPLVRLGPGGENHVDVPIMYNGFALDRIHFDPLSMRPLPKGKPGVKGAQRVREEEVRKAAQEILSELRVLDAAEFRDPESAWAVPVAWRHLIVAHIKVSYDGGELVPDYGLTGEVMRYAP